jgi:hypothetical protein
MKKINLFKDIKTQKYLILTIYNLFFFHLIHQIFFESIEIKRKKLFFD